MGHKMYAGQLSWWDGHRHTVLSFPQPPTFTPHAHCQSSAPGIAFACYFLSQFWSAGSETAPIAAVGVSVSTAVQSYNKTSRIFLRAVVFLNMSAILPYLTFAKHQIWPGLYAYSLLPEDKSSRWASLMTAHSSPPCQSQQHHGPPAARICSPVTKPDFMAYSHSSEVWYLFQLTARNLQSKVCCRQEQLHHLSMSLLL